MFNRSSSASTNISNTSTSNWSNLQDQRGAAESGGIAATAGSNVYSQTNISGTDTADVLPPVLAAIQHIANGAMQAGTDASGIAARAATDSLATTGRLAERSVDASSRLASDSLASTGRLAERSVDASSRLASDSLAATAQLADRSARITADTMAASSALAGSATEALAATRAASAADRWQLVALVGLVVVLALASGKG